MYFIPYTSVPPLYSFPISNVDMNELSECQKLQTYGVDSSITCANKHTWLSHYSTHNQPVIILKYSITQYKVNLPQYMTISTIIELQVPYSKVVEINEFSTANINMITLV